jgi:hypothetical protein
MFHPVGSQPPSVYWRRRFILIASVVLLIVLLAVTIKVATGGSGGSPTAAGTTGRTKTATPPTSTAPAHPRTTASRSTPPAKHSSSVSAPATKSGSRTSSPPAAPVACTSNDLSVLAVVAQSSYKVGDEPMVEMQVTNTGASPCIENLSDKEIVLKVYNGESRVWGSHDCKVEPGNNEQTLAVNAPVRVSITWTGLASKPGECNNRQRVGAGTYTLYATLAGKTGHAAQFSIS